MLEVTEIQMSIEYWRYSKDRGVYWRCQRDQRFRGTEVRRCQRFRGSKVQRHQGAEYR